MMPDLDKYRDRREAGMVLADCLKEYANRPDALILALPRGGVPVAYEVSRALSIPLDVFVVRKLGFPGQEEFAIGAIASGGTLVFNEALQPLPEDRTSIDKVIKKEQKELQRREKRYRGSRPPLALKGKTIILVDDGIATGSTMHAAINALRAHQPAALIVAVPVAALSACETLKSQADKFICPLKPREFYAVSLWYEQFPQTSDDEVIALLHV